MTRPGPDPSVSDEDIIRVIVANEKPVMGTTEIADRLGISQQAMSRHLKRLADEGALKTDKVGQARVWWPTDEGFAYLDLE